MKNHVTDLKWSTKLKEMGFPHKPLFGDGFIATELWEELPETRTVEDGDTVHLYVCKNGHQHQVSYAAEEGDIYFFKEDPNLCNALAALWCQVKGG